MWIIDKLDFLKEMCSVNKPEAQRCFYVLRIIKDLGVCEKEGTQTRELKKETEE